MFGLANPPFPLLYYCTVQRPLWLRLLIGLWAVWFNAALLEAPGIHTCAVHSGVAAGGHAHRAAAMPMPSHSHMAHDSTQTAPSKDAGTCSCLGACCSAAPVVPSEPAVDIVAHYTAIAARRVGNAVAAPSVERPYARPFANGPPTLV
jgi:hypothetical protein